jgi:phosphoribosylanthranilate isomerase
MTWIKICGITNLEDALTAVKAGADALGFVFYDKSPRKIAPEAAGEIITKLPPEVEKVGVFVNESAGRVGEIAERVGLTAIQLHGEASRNRKALNALNSSSRKIYIPLTAGELFDKQGRFRGFGWRAEAVSTVDALLVDSGTRRRPGGTGKVFDWEKTAPVIAWISQTFRVVIAGGLKPTNVADAIRMLKPWGVDVASGVEARPGKKDPEKVRAFIAAVRHVEEST